MQQWLQIEGRSKHPRRLTSHTLYHVLQRGMGRPASDHCMRFKLAGPERCERPQAVECAARLVGDAHSVPTRHSPLPPLRHSNLRVDDRQVSGPAVSVAARTALTMEGGMERRPHRSARALHVSAPVPSVTSTLSFRFKMRDGPTARQPAAGSGSWARPVHRRTRSIAGTGASRKSAAR